MFSSKELVSFVFANENDIYYGDDLLKRDLNQYLWERLHGNYEAVYFLSAKEKGFSIRSYGDRCCCEYTPKKKLFGVFGGTEQCDQGSWILRQLRGKPAAFVCSLEDFCTVLSDTRWDDVLTEIAEETKRTGIFVLTASTTAERTTDLLLESPVFKKLREIAVTDLRVGAVRELYSALKKRKWDSCIFLNTFSWERIRAVLLHLVMEHPDRCDSREQLDAMTEYLYAYLHDPEIAEQDVLLPGGLPAEYLMYSQLYEWLSNDRTWEKLAQQSDRFAQRDNCRKRAENSGTNVPVLRDLKSYAGRCVKLRPPKWVKGCGEAEEQTENLLNSIRCEVAAPKNRKENPEIATAAEELLNRLEAVRDGDTGTYNQVLSALKFCVNQIYAIPEKEETARVLEIIKKHRETITIFDQCFVLERDLAVSQPIDNGSVLQGATLQQLKVKLKTLQQLKRKYVDLISAMELQLKMPASVGNITDMLETLEREIETFGQQPQEEAVEQEMERLLTENEEEPEEEFILTADVYSFIPPSVHKNPEARNGNLLQ